MYTNCDQYLRYVRKVYIISIDYYGIFYKSSKISIKSSKKVVIYIQKFKSIILETLLFVFHKYVQFETAYPLICSP